MTPTELYKEISEGKDIQLLDVRELYEYRICRLNDSLHIPIHEFLNRIVEVSKERDLVVLCHHGIRSAMVVNYLKKNGYEKVYNLEGGINRWAIEIDPEMTKY